jgi:hypothetical protein
MGAVRPTFLSAAYRTLSLPRCGKSLGADLNCSELRLGRPAPPCALGGTRSIIAAMRALGHSGAVCGAEVFWLLPAGFIAPCLPMMAPRPRRREHWG